MQGYKGLLGQGLEQEQEYLKLHTLFGFVFYEVFRHRPQPIGRVFELCQRRNPLLLVPALLDEPS